MSLLEGFSDYVMDEVGRDLVPDVERISARFHERRTQRTPFERAVLRLTGMDLKMEQYQKGEAFVRAIADAPRTGGPDPALGGPETLPRDGEIDDARALDRAGSSTAGRPRSVTGTVTRARSAAPDRAARAAVRAARRRPSP